MAEDLFRNHSRVPRSVLYLPHDGRFFLRHEPPGSATPQNYLRDPTAPVDYYRCDLADVFGPVPHAYTVAFADCASDWRGEEFNRLAETFLTAVGRRQGASFFRERVLGPLVLCKVDRRSGQDLDTDAADFVALHAWLLEQEGVSQGLLLERAGCALM